MAKSVQMSECSARESLSAQRYTPSRVLAKRSLLSWSNSAPALRQRSDQHHAGTKGGAKGSMGLHPSQLGEVDPSKKTLLLTHDKLLALPPPPEDSGGKTELPPLPKWAQWVDKFSRSLDWLPQPVRSFVGWSLVTIGAVLGFQPVPVGFPIAAAGFATIGPEDRALRKGRVKLKRYLLHHTASRVARFVLRWVNKLERVTGFKPRRRSQKRRARA